jgi:hypothetical protein
MDMTTAFRSEVFRPLVTIVIPGTISLTSYFFQTKFDWKIRSFRHKGLRKPFEVRDAHGVSADQTELYRRDTVHHVGGRSDAGIPLPLLRLH